MFYYDRIQKTRKLGDQLADKIIERLLNVKEMGLQEKIDLTLKLAQLVKIMDYFEERGFERNDE